MKNRRLTVSHIFWSIWRLKGLTNAMLCKFPRKLKTSEDSPTHYTSREFTAFYCKMLKGDTELAVDVLTDILQNSTFPEDELVKEREVVVQEIKQTIDTPDDIVFDYFQETAFPDQAIGRSILGSEGKRSQFYQRKAQQLYSH